MSPIAQLRAFAQSIYLIIKNRYFDDIEGADGVVFVNQIIDWANMFVDELEGETKPDGAPINWKWARELGYELGTASTGTSSIDAPTEILELLTDQQRYVQILQDGTAVSNWAVVEPSQISSRTDRITEDMAAFVGSTIAFSRAFKDTEEGGTIVGDVQLSLPRLSLTNVKLLNTVKPALLLKLGVAKNTTLPDIVQGGLSPSYAQKYKDLLDGAIARNEATSRGDVVVQENLNSVRGV